MKQTQLGFTLIELMVTVAIIGILASIAYPTYQESVMKSRRADVKGVMLNLANAMERHFTENSSYCDAADAGGTVVANCGEAAEDTGTASVYVIPPETATFYGVTIFAVTRNSYTLGAVPEATGAQANDDCGTLTLDQTGAKGVINAASGFTADICW